jgi:hypothetical protein
MMAILTDACPSYRLPGDDRDLLYVLLGDFARHLLELQQKNRTEEFPAIASAIERFHTEGDSFVREAATIGLLEGVQNVWGNNDTDPNLFGRHLLPASAKAWQNLNDFWNGKRKSLGENS